MIVARPQSLLLFRLPTTAAESEKMPKKRDEGDSGGDSRQRGKDWKGHIRQAIDELYKRPKCLNGCVFNFNNSLPRKKWILAHRNTTLYELLYY